MSESNALQELADRQAITDLIYRYCRSVDRIDPELGYTVWHEDGEADYGEHVFQGSGRGVIDYICNSHKHALAHSHQISNIIINLNGELAGSETYVTANIRMEKDGKLLNISVWSRYVDQWSKRDGRWGIDKRVTVFDFDEIREVTAMNKASLACRDRNDPSYQVLP